MPRSDRWSYDECDWSGPTLTTSSGSDELLSVNLASETPPWAISLNDLIKSNTKPIAKKEHFLEPYQLKINELITKIESSDEDDTVLINILLNECNTLLWSLKGQYDSENKKL